MAKPIGLNWNVELSFYRKKFRPPPPQGGRRGPPPEIFFCFFSRFRPFLVDLDQKKIFKNFFPPGRGQPPSLPREKKFEIFFLV